MKIAFLFPGQGAQAIGMGKDLYEKYEEVRNIYDKVKEITNIDIASLSFDGPEEKLNRTKYTQLAILTNSLAILEILKKNNIKAEISAGLSLGEYSALIYSEILDFDEGIKLVQKRGEYMENSVPEGEWKMAAILGLEDEQVEKICNNVKGGFVVPANYNCKGQIAISGESKAITEAEQMAKEMGAKKVRVLKTAGPFHTEKLTEASKKLREELQKIKIHNGKSKVVKNIDGTEYKDSDDVRNILEKHIISPVMFSKTIQTMLNEKIDTFIEVGCGKTLSGFVKRTPTDKKINILNINNISNLESTINFIKEAQTNE
ncbi:MAG: ACP S-malonyltransferase [Clostridia bacterium]|nr:ACP S-malonyltransferase [Clostridia bacterium]